LLADLIDFLQQSWVVLSLLAALGYASIGYIDEWLLRRHGENGEGLPDDAAGKLIIISGLFGFVVSSIFVVVAALTGDFYNLWATPDSFTPAIAAGAIEIIWLVPYFYAMQRAGALNATPLFQSVPVFSLLVGVLIFAEYPPATQIGGAIVIATGAFILNFDFSQRTTDWPTLGLMFLASALISLEYFLFKDAALDMGFVFSAFWSGVGMVLATAIIWLVWPPYRRQFKRYLSAADRLDLGVQFGNEGLNSASVLASQFAVTRGPSVMLVSAFNAFHPLFTLLIGWMLARFGSDYHSETLRGGRAMQKSVAIALIAAGTIVIALY
jgi:uncharacterized membrane protein